MQNWCNDYISNFTRIVRKSILFSRQPMGGYLVDMRTIDCFSLNASNSHNNYNTKKPKLVFGCSRSDYNLAAHSNVILRNKSLILLHWYPLAGEYVARNALPMNTILNDWALLLSNMRTAFIKRTIIMNFKKSRRFFGKKISMD